MRFTLKGKIRGRKWVKKPGGGVYTIVLGRKIILEIVLNLDGVTPR